MVVRVLGEEHDLIRAERPAIGHLEAERVGVEVDHGVDIVHVDHCVGDLEAKSSCHGRSVVTLPRPIVSGTQRLATNGVETTRPGRPAPRTSTTTSVPTSVLGGMNASAIPWPSTGEKFPLVTMPTG